MRTTKIENPKVHYFGDTGEAYDDRDLAEARGYPSYEEMQGDPGQDGEDERDSNGLPLDRTLGCTCSAAQIERVGCECRHDEMPF